jgi:hypothetical protein
MSAGSEIAHRESIGPRVATRRDRVSTSTDATTLAPPAVGHDDAYIAHLWEHPRLCLALFGVQFLTPEGQRLYEQSGISEEMFPALDVARESGLLLHNRMLMTEEGPVLMQYWRSHEDLDRWARQLPHMSWWRWLLEHAGADLSFYHEIYQVKAAEAIYEKGCQPVGPARFSTTTTVGSGEGRSKDRQARFVDAANTAPE